MTQSALTVYFDGACPLCRKEIAFYKRRKGADAILWVDVSQANDHVADDLSCAEALARFHVRGADGVLLDGGDAFAALWRALPGFKWLGVLFGPQPLRWLLNRAYDAFLPLRPRLQALAGSKAAQDARRR